MNGATALHHPPFCRGVAEGNITSLVVRLCLLSLLSFAPAIQAEVVASRPATFNAWLDSAHRSAANQASQFLEVPPGLLEASNQPRLIAALRAGPVPVRVALIRSLGEVGASHAPIVDELLRLTRDSEESISSQAIMALAKLDDRVEARLVGKLFKAVEAQRRLDEEASVASTNSKLAHLDQAREIEVLGTALKLRDDLDVGRFLVVAGRSMQAVSSEGVLALAGASAAPKVQASGFGERYSRDEDENVRLDYRDSDNHNVYRSVVESLRFVLGGVPTNELIERAFGPSALGPGARAAALLVAVERSDVLMIAGSTKLRELVASKDRLLATLALRVSLNGLSSMHPDFDSVLASARRGAAGQESAFVASNVRRLRADPLSALEVLHDRLRRKQEKRIAVDSWERIAVSKYLQKQFAGGGSVPRRDARRSRSDSDAFSFFLGLLNSDERKSILQAMAQSLRAADAGQIPTAISNISEPDALSTSEVLALLRELEASRLGRDALAAATAVMRIASSPERMRSTSTIALSMLDRTARESTRNWTLDEPNEDDRARKNRQSFEYSLEWYVERALQALSESDARRLFETLLRLGRMTSRDLPESVLVALVKRGDPFAVDLLRATPQLFEDRNKWATSLCTAVWAARSISSARAAMTVHRAETGHACPSPAEDALHSDRILVRLQALQQLAARHRPIEFVDEILAMDSLDDAAFVFRSMANGSLDDLHSGYTDPNSRFGTAIRMAASIYPEAAVRVLRACPWTASADDADKRCQRLAWIVRSAGRTADLESLHRVHLRRWSAVVAKARGAIDEGERQRILGEGDFDRSLARALERVLPDSRTIANAYIEEVLSGEGDGYDAMEYLRKYESLSPELAARVVKIVSGRIGGGWFLPAEIVLRSGAEPESASARRVDEAIQTLVVSLRKQLAGDLYNDRSAITGGSGGGGGNLGVFDQLPQLLPWPPAYSHASRLDDLVEPHTLVMPGDSVDAVVKRIRAGLRSVDSRFESGIFGVPNGFILLTRVERFDADGRPLPGASRWLKDTAVVPPASLREYVEAMFRLRPGYSRIFGFLFVVEGGLPPSAKVVDAIPPPRSGLLELPRSLGELPAAQFERFALVFSFERKPGALPELDTRLSAGLHIERSGFLRVSSSGRRTVPIGPLGVR